MFKFVLKDKVFNLEFARRSKREELESLKSTFPFPDQLEIIEETSNKESNNE